MPRRHRKTKTMKGGFLDSLSSWGTSLTQSASNLWNKTKSSLTGTNTYTGSYTPSYSSTSSTPVSTTPVQPMTTSTYGGKTRRRQISGGFKDNTPQTGLAVNAASFSGETAKPHNWVGGKTKRRNKKHKCKKSCRNRH